MIDETDASKALRVRWTGRSLSAAVIVLAGTVAALGPHAHADRVTTPTGPASASVEVPSAQSVPGVGTDTCTSFTNQKQHASDPFTSPDPLDPQPQWTFNTDIYVSRTCPDDAVITKIVPYATNVLTPDWTYFDTQSATADGSTAEATGDFGYYPSWAPPPPGAAPDSIGLDQGCQNIIVIVEPRANYCRAHLYPQILWSVQPDGTASYIMQWG